MHTTMYTPLDTGEAGRAKGNSSVRRSGVEIYSALQGELRSGRVTGWDRLSEEPLAERFGVSRTPVREALTRLVSEGILERRNGGIYMALPSFEELAGLYELRVTLELRGIQRALDESFNVHDAGVLERELQRWSDLAQANPKPTPRFVAEDEQFHVVLLGSAGNPALTAALVTVNDKIRAVRMYDYLTADRIDSTIREHTEILELLLQRKLLPAYEALREHIGASQDVVMERASQAFANLTLINMSREDNR
ncbi:DNA-binding GntR family transcriptional regulator [Arthrobacter sp. CAN_A214]|uniref:GntR family transcriptional regulator n=1 Tax=Arthrobacter sp. CAN_A214 TaxID=2787720 RepID=UPI001A206258